MPVLPFSYCIRRYVRISVLPFFPKQVWSLTKPFPCTFRSFLLLHRSATYYTAVGNRNATFVAGSRSLCSSAGVSGMELDDAFDDKEEQKKAEALRHAIVHLSGDFDKASMLLMQKFFTARRAPVITTGSLKLDLALGIGGLPQGRMVEIYGREASGKTTLALHIIKEAQKRGGYCAYLDVENALDSSIAESMGVDLENLLIAPPDAAENMLSIVDTLTRSGSLDVIIVDSVAALLPKQELVSPITYCQPDIQSRILSQALRKIHSALCQSKTVLIFLNQVRYSSTSKLGLGRMDEVTCGGNALKFYSAIRLRMSRTGLLETGNQVNGIKVSVQVVKNKLSPVTKKAEIRIKFGSGFCRELEVFELACEYGMISKDGCRYSAFGKTFQDQSAVIDYLANNVETLDDMASALRNEMLEWNVEQK